MHRQADVVSVGTGRTPEPTLLRLTSSDARVREGEPFALAAQVRTAEGEAPAARGAVEFRAGGRLLGTATVDQAGQAVLAGVLLVAGVHAVTAAYSGDARYAAASSPALPQAVTAQASPVVLLVAAPAPRAEGVMLEAELIDPHTGRLAEDATGQLIFTSGSDTVAVVDLIAGHARVVVDQLPPGGLRVLFPGDTEHAPTSATVLAPT